MSSQIPFDRHSQKFKFTRVPNAKYATVRKSLKVPKGSSQTHEELLLSVDKENWTDGGIKIGFTEPLEFSLNKKCRWELLEEFRSNLANWNSLNHQRCVSAVERIIPFGWTNKTRLGIQPKWYKRQNEMKTVSSHQYINGEEYHIAGKQGKYFNLSDKQVIRNAEPPKKLRKKKVATFRRAPESPAIMPEDKDIVGINYELLYPTDSLKLYEKEKKKLAGAKDPDKPYWKAKEVKFKQKYRKYIDFEAASDDFCESDDADSASPVEELVKCQWSLGDFIVEERTKKAKKIINEELVCNEEMFDFPMCSKALMFDVEFGSSGYASNSSNAGSNSRLDSVGEDLITTEDFKPRKFEVMTEEELETFWEQQNYVNQAKVLENVHEISNRSSRRNIAKKERRKARKLVEQNKPKPPEVKITFTPVSNFQPGSKNFQMLPAEVDLPTAQLSHNFLQENFGFGYYEVHAIPRRFCVDISSLVRDGFIRADKRLEVEIICVFEPYKHGENVTKCRVWLNGLFTDDVSSTAMHCLNTYKPQEINEVIKSAVKSILICPSEHFSMAKISLTPSQYQHQWNGVEQAAKLLSDVRVFSVKEAVQFVTDQIEGDLPSLGEICGTSRSSEVCEICMTSREKSIGCANSSCSHWFCNDCWVEFSTEQIRNGRVPLRCPAYGCKTVLTHQLMSTFLPLSLLHRYRSLSFDQFISQHRDQWFWCPTPRCGRILHRLDTAGSMGSCACGSTWCFQCSQEAHWPATCAQAKFYRRNLALNGEDEDFNLNERVREVKAKPCPHCKVPMEKLYGCNHMQCRCGREFCWSCLKNWDSSEHYSCTPDNTANMETFFLVDLTDGMSKEWLERCLRHRHELLTFRIRQVNQKFSQCLKTKKANDYNRSDLQRRFLSLFKHTHYVIQYVLVWLHYSKYQSSVQTGLLMRIERIKFVISQMEEAAAANDFERAVRLLTTAENQLKPFLDGLTLLKNREISFKKS